MTTTNQPAFQFFGLEQPAPPVVPQPLGAEQSPFRIAPPSMLPAPPIDDRFARQADVALAEAEWEQAEQQAKRDVIAGALFLIGGIAITAFTYDMAASSPGGGTYMLAWGPMLYGVVRLCRGLFGRRERQSSI